MCAEVHANIIQHNDTARKAPVLSVACITTPRARTNSSADDAWFGVCGGAPAQRWPVRGFELPLLGGEEGRAL